MAFLFGGAPSRAGGGEGGRAPNPFREHQRELRAGIRTLEREEARGLQAERVQKAEIVRLAKEQRLDLCKAKAREMIRHRAHRNRLGTIKFHMNSMANQLTTMRSAQQLQQIMGKTTRLLQGINRNMDPRAVHRMLCEFERQNAAFNDGQEILEETLDAVFEADDESSAADAAMAQVFEEMGLDIQGRLGGLSSSSAAARGSEPPPSMEDLEARLQRLRVP